MKIEEQPGTHLVEEENNRGKWNGLEQHIYKL